MNYLDFMASPAEQPAPDPLEMEPLCAWSFACLLGTDLLNERQNARDNINLAPARRKRAALLQTFEAFVATETPTAEIVERLRGTFGLGTALSARQGIIPTNAKASTLRLIELIGLSNVECATQDAKWLHKAISADGRLGPALFRGPSHLALATMAKSTHATQSSYLAMALKNHARHNVFNTQDEPFMLVACGSDRTAGTLAEWLCTLATFRLPDWIPSPEQLSPETLPVFTIDHANELQAKMNRGGAREEYKKSGLAPHLIPIEEAKAWRAALECMDKLRALGLPFAENSFAPSLSRVDDSGRAILISEAIRTNAVGTHAAERLGYAALKARALTQQIFGDKAEGFTLCIKALGGGPEVQSFELPGELLNRWLFECRHGAPWTEAIGEFAKAGAILSPIPQGGKGNRALSISARIAAAITEAPTPELAAQCHAIGVDPLEIPASGRCMLSFCMKTSSVDECIAGMQKAFAYGKGAGLTPTDMMHSRDSDGSGPMHWATRALSPEAAQLCFELGADPNTRDNDGATAAHWLSKKTSTKWDGNLAAVAKKLSILGVDFSITDNNGATPIKLMARASPDEALAACLGIRPDVVDQKNFDGKAALDLLVERGAKWMALGESAAMSSACSNSAPSAPQPRRKFL